MMALSLDSNILIESKNRHFPMDVVPGFWDALDRGMSQGEVFVIYAVYTEIVSGNDELARWMKARKQHMQDERSCVETQAQYPNVGRAVENRTPRYRPAAIHQFHTEADPWIIAHALAHGHTVVSHEVAVPDRVRKVAIPDICQPLHVPCITVFELLRTLGVKLILG